MDWGSLAATIAAKGGPIIAEALGSVLPWPFSMLVKSVVGALAQSFGVPPDDPGALSNAIQNDPAAVEKIQAVEEKYKADLQSALDFAKLQVEQNEKLVDASKDLAVGWRIFFAGWRPAFCWMVVVFVGYMLTADVMGWPMIRSDTWNPVWLLFGGMAGLRSVDKFCGTAADMIGTAAGRKALARRKG